MPQSGDEEEADGPASSHGPVYGSLSLRPVEVSQHVGESIFCAVPFFGPLLFDNTDSDCRDHCANERTFLSYLRLSVYLSVVAIAIVISFHLKHQPSKLELQMALPLGIMFWVLAVACLALGFGNYIKTVTKYSRRMALVQTGWKTQAVFTVLAVCIIAVCIIFLSTDSVKSSISISSVSWEKQGVSKAQKAQELKFLAGMEDQ